jgi:L-ascorbate metabolism protein UlaG (beta-lactamase superfamily)
MKLTKYLHSCLLVEEQGKTILIDPGQFTYDSKVFDITKLPSLDFILITHEHADHMSIQFIKELLSKFPNVEIITTESAVTKLQEEQIEASSEGNEYIAIESIPHEDIVFAVPPENVQFTLFGKLTDPGDSYHVKKTAHILALPIQAPWGSFADALKLAESLSPKYIIPIHDWHWKDEVRKQLYGVAKDYLQQSDIEFKGIETGESIEINI